MDKRAGFAGCGLAAVLLLGHPAGAATVQGYAWPTSVAPGDSVRIHVSTDAATFDATFIREGAAGVVHLTLPGIPGSLQPVPGRPWDDGCGWVPSFAVRIPPDWPSGVYTVRLDASGASPAYAIFVVREAKPGRDATILFQTSLLTWEAYNDWGGFSLYTPLAPGGMNNYVVSFQRPFKGQDGRGQFLSWELPMIRWLEGSGYRVAYCTGVDLHDDPDLPARYPLFLSVGHDEYWSREMRDHLEERIAAGGNVAFLSGNVSWWQIRFSDSRDRIYCYKDKNRDPFYRTDRSRVTVNWYADPVFRPENAMTGVSYRNGGYVNDHGFYPASQGHGGYTVHRSDHWVYEGTGLSDGDTFGRAATIVGYETDGALFTWENGLPVATGGDGTPAGFTILGLSPASMGNATMGLYVHPDGGTVFTAATIDWAQGLASDPSVARITANLLDRLALSAAGGGDEVIQPPDDGGVMGHLVRALQNPARGRAELEWTGLAGMDPSVAIYGTDGRLLSRLPVTGGLSHGTVVWNGRDLAGRMAPAGVYVARLEGFPVPYQAKFVLLR